MKNKKHSYGIQALKLHKKLAGKIEITSKIKIKTKEDLSTVYTPGVGSVSLYLAKNKNKTGEYTIKGNSVAIISDGSAVLGLGNIGPEGALPVMEGKAMIMKEFAGLDAIPIVLNTQNTEEIISAVKAIAPTFGAINLEDISAPRCFEIEERLKQELDIPIMHDDQWGTSVVVLAALINATKLAGKNIKKSRIVILGAGAAGSAIIKILHKYGARNIIAVDRDGIIHVNDNSPAKAKLAEITNPQNEKGNIEDALIDADVFIGVSKGGLVTEEMIKKMADKPIVFALANPVPEIMPDAAKRAGAYIVASGRSDFPNQVNNALAFPGIFRGAIDNKVKKITKTMLIRAAENIAKSIKPSKEKIIPNIFDKRIIKIVSRAIK
ncbi:MAG TPA: NADP-dependent malic enzyme [Candidatus Paceibacterota bacterium]